MTWRDDSETWYSALVSAGTMYGLARRRVEDGRVYYEVLDRATGEWRHDPEGAGKWTGLGRITDADPGTLERAREIEAELRLLADER